MIIQVNKLYKTYKVRKKSSFWRNIFNPEYREVHAVNGISFEIKKGEAVAFLGPNGAGKTTTMKMLTGLIHPTSGEIKVLGLTPFDRKKQFLTKIGLVMGNKTSLDWDLTSKQSFELLQKIYHIPKEKFEMKVRELTSLVGTTELLDIQARKLSLGERLKMELIGAILHEPEILFLDEPTIGLDIPSKQKIREFLRNIQQESGVTLLLTSHDTDDIEKVCDRVIVINKGEKVYDNSLSRLTKHYNKEKFIKIYFKKIPEEQKLIKIAEIVDIEEKTYTIKVSSRKMPEVLAYLTSNFELLDVDILSVPLDEIISDIFKKTGNIN